jgi:hypothetical protein
MSEMTTPRNVWFQPSNPLSPQERVRRLVAALTRARRLQFLADHVAGGLLTGLAAATLATLGVRLLAVPYSLWQITGAAIGVALTVAVALSWRRRPDALEVAICADVTLKLKQRLSTAWEIMTVRGDCELSERLAVQAVNCELPNRPGQVFPLRVNRWGILLPLPAAALLLVSVVDLNRAPATVPREVDERVISEGQRLSAFARAMQARAKRDALARSDRQSAQLERLGARMESGALSRAQALEQLRRMGRSLDEDSLQALAETRQPAGVETPPRQRASSLPNASGGVTAGGMSERAVSGASGEDARAMTQERFDDLLRSGVPRHELEDAIRRKQAAADDTAREKLRKPDLSARALQDHEELQRAREQVRRARENLDDALAGGDSGGGSATDMESGESDETPEDRAADKRRGQRKSGKAPRYGARGDDSTFTKEAPESPPERPSQASGPVMKPQAEMRAGEVFSSQGSVLPNVTRPTVENVDMKPEFASQLEDVLSRDHYPAHYKEFIRRYFLSLSQEPGPKTQPDGGRDGRGE